MHLMFFKHIAAAFFSLPFIWSDHNRSPLCHKQINVSHFSPIAYISMTIYSFASPPLYPFEIEMSSFVDITRYHVS